MEVCFHLFRRLAEIIYGTSVDPICNYCNYIITVKGCPNPMPWSLRARFNVVITFEKPSESRSQLWLVV